MADEPKNESGDAGGAEDSDAPVDVSTEAIATLEAAKPKPKKKKAKKAKSDADKEASKAGARVDDGHFGATKAIAALPGAGTPDGDTLRAARIAFEVGDYRAARELAARIVGSENRAVADAAQDVLRRTGVDQVQIAFLAACALAIIAIAWIYIPH